MKVRPILFSPPMVLAMIDGRKTQTRRSLLSRHRARIPHYPGQGTWLFTWDPFSSADSAAVVFRCPYGKPGDLLWVRETWNTVENNHGNDAPQYRANIQPSEWKQYGPWRSPYHMRRAHSRLTLRITDVRVQRLQDISDRGATNDCTDEGVFHCGLNLPTDWQERGFRSIEKCAYRDLWDHINGAGAWDANPWVWALTFEVIKQNVDTVIYQMASRGPVSTQTRSPTKETT